MTLVVTSNVFATTITEDEPSNNLSSSATIIPTTSIGQVLDASLADAADTDYFELSPSNSGGYCIEITGNYTLGAVLYDSNLNVLDKLIISDGVHNLIGELTASNSYYIKFYSSSTSDYGNYSFNVKFTRPLYDEVEPNDLSTSSNTLPSVNYATLLKSTINATGDQDYFTFTPGSSGSYTIETTGTTDTFGYLYDSEMNFLVSDNDSGDVSNFKLTYNLTGRQKYYILAQGFSLNCMGEYNIKVTPPDSIGNDTEGDNFSTALNLGVDPVTYVGLQINSSSDVDFYEFTAADSGIYTFSTLGLIDTYGDLYDSNQVLLTSDDNNGDGNNFKFEAQLTANQVCYIKVSSGNGLAGSYGISIVKGRTLNVPKYTQLPYNNLCWATGDAMVISYLNNDSVNRTLDIAKAEALVDGASVDNCIYPSYFDRAQAFIDPMISEGITHTTVSYYLYTNTSGFNFRFLNFTHTGSYLNRPLTFDDVKDRIDASYPIVALIKWESVEGGHVQVITGYYVENNIQYIVYLDPLALDGKAISMPFANYLSNTSWYLQNYIIAKDAIPLIPVNTDHDITTTDRFESILDNDMPNGTSSISGNNVSISGSIGLNGDTVDYYQVSTYFTEDQNLIINMSVPTDTVVGIYKWTQGGISLVSEYTSNINCTLEAIQGTYLIKLSNSSNSGAYNLNISMP